MKPEHWKQAKKIVPRAEELSPEERPAFLDRACAGDDELRQLVETLLAADPESLEDHLQAPPFKLLTDESVPEQIEAYRILGEIGRGGAGIVYLAEHTEEQFDHRVAIKIHPGEVDTSLAEHFRFERQTLADLVHPGIGRLLGGGSLPDGRPYFIMEYLKGVPITRYCEQHKLDIPARLQLFSRVCEAVEFAHKNLVIHRDLKPAHILVTNSGEPKLLDFGIAKLMQADESPEESQLQEIDRFLTLRYASPEHVQGEKTTTASDVYSLGVILYELLTGRLPYNYNEGESIRPEQVITEREPTKPSSVLGVSPGDSQRQTAALLRGDLDAILLKALQKQPEQRYSSVEKFSEDTQRYLRRLPVLVRKQTLLYRTNRLVRRRPLAVCATAIFLLLVFGFGTAMIWQYRQTILQRDRAEQTLDFLIDLFNISDPYRGSDSDLSAKELLEKASANLQKSLFQQETVRAELLSTVGRINQNLGLYDSARPMLEEALELRREEHGPASEAAAESLYVLGELYRAQGDFDAAKTKIQEGLTAQRQLFGSNSTEFADSLRSLALLLKAKGNHEKAEDLLREALEIYKASHNADTATTAEILSHLAGTLYASGNPNQAHSLYIESLSIREALFGKNHILVSESLNGLAIVANRLGQYEEAAQLLQRVLEIARKSLGEEHPDVAMILNNLGAVLRNQGNLGEAESAQREALSIRRKLLPDDHPHVTMSLSNLGKTLTAKGNYPAAEEALQECLQLRLNLGDNHPSVAVTLNDLGRLHVEMNEYREATDFFQRALAIRDNVGNDIEIATTNHNLGRALAGLGECDLGEQHLSIGLELFRSTLGENHSNVGSSLSSLGRLKTECGSYDEAENLLRQALENYRHALPQDHIKIMTAKSRLGASLVRLGRAEEALPMLLTSYEKIQLREGRDSDSARYARAAIAAAYESLGRNEEAGAYKSPQFSMAYE